MIVSDPLYGEFDYPQLVIGELLQAPTMLRLKDITQAGVPKKYNKLDAYGRYEHSVGVMLLLKKLGVPFEEQVAGLLHDISHLAFSHVAEWVFEENGSSSESMNQTLAERFVMDSEIKGILQKSGLDPKRIIDLNNFKTLKAPTPDINADRGDYSLREIYKWRDKKIALEILSSLELHDGTIVVNNIEAAKKFGREFLVLQTQYWGGHDAVLRYHLFSQLLKKLVSQGTLQFEDFTRGEEPIMKLINNSTDSDVISTLEILSHKDLSPLKGKFDLTIMKKFRFIDPMVHIDRKYLRLSEIDRDFADLLSSERTNSEKGTPI